MTAAVERPRIAVLGLGEAGSVIAEDLARAADVVGYDPKHSEPTGHYATADSEATAARDADVIMVLTTGADAPDALAGLSAGARDEALVLDATSSAPGQKRELADAAGDRLRYVDAVFMAPVRPTRIGTPVLASGPAAADAAATLNRLGMKIEAIGPRVGDAAVRKLLRSIVVKGLSALMIEGLQTARGQDQLDWFSEHLSDTLTELTPAILIRLLDGTPKHSERRQHEMAAAETMVRESGLDPVMTAATVRLLAGLNGDAVVPRGSVLQ